MIIQHVSPDDLESFTSSCRGIYRLATKDLEKHRALKREHTVHRYGNAYEASLRWSASQLLDEILSKPRTALYIREILLHRSYWNPMASMDLRPRPEDMRLPYSEETNARARLKEEVSRLAPQDDVAQWLWYYDLGSETHIISLFLLLLPNLSTLRIIGVHAHHPCLYNTISRITTMKYPGAPLARLRHAQVSQSVDLFLVIAALPSLVSIEGVDLWGRPTEPGLGNLMPRTRNIRELVLTRCSIHPRLFSDFLGSLKALRLFTYDLQYQKYQQAETGTLDPSWVCSALCVYFGSTLECLTLLSHHKGRHFMGDIRGLKNLRKLHTESQLLLKESDRYRNDASLAKSLPPKLETLELELECSGEGDETFIAKSIVKLAELRPRHVPALKEVKVVTPNGVEDFNTSKDDPTGAHHVNASAAAEEDCYTYDFVAAACKAQGFDLSVGVFDPAILESYERGSYKRVTGGGNRFKFHRRARRGRKK